MKKTAILALVILINACQFNQSVNKDLTTGAYSRGDGLGSDDTQIEINGKIDNRNTFIQGEKVNFIFNNVKGLNRIDNRTFPGLSIRVLNKNKDTVLSESDLFKENINGFDLASLRLNTHFIAAIPTGKDYKVYITIWDKKGDGTFSYEMPFEVEANKLLNITSNNITYKNIYLWNQSKKLTVIENTININDEFILIADKLNGLQPLEGNVYPIISIEITDDKGNKIVSNTNVLSQYEKDGINMQEFAAGQVPITINFTKGKVFNPCTLKVVLTDKNSTSNLEIISNLIIK